MKTPYPLFLGLLGAFCLLQGSNALAYTGAYGVAPALNGGPDSIYVTDFDLITANGPTTIPMDLYYVQSVTIETTEPVEDHLLIKEYPAGTDSTFDIIVPQPVQQVLKDATINIWAPDRDSLVVRHVHQGAETAYETATKISPTIENADGNVLWSFHVKNFSSFSYFTPAQHRDTVTASAVAAWFILIWFVALGPLALRHR